MMDVRNPEFAGGQPPLPRRDDDLITEVELADWLEVSLRTLQGWRVRGGGPRYVRISSRCVRYRVSCVRAWIEARLASHTSEVTQAEADDAAQ
jgi:predicted DNA-binding transcriptional regulator AlpA